MLRGERGGEGLSRGVRARGCNVWTCPHPPVPPSRFFSSTAGQLRSASFQCGVLRFSEMLDYVGYDAQAMNSLCVSTHHEFA